jgi:hypothetical protein
MIPVFEMEKTYHALEVATTVLDTSW